MVFPSTPSRNTQLFTSRPPFLPLLSSLFVRYLFSPFQINFLFIFPLTSMIFGIFSLLILRRLIFFPKGHLLIFPKFQTSIFMCRSILAGRLVQNGSDPQHYPIGQHKTIRSLLNLVTLMTEASMGARAKLSSSLCIRVVCSAAASAAAEETTMCHRFR